ncbi:MAG: alpha/beta fold hydrolase [Micropepsaceae bacterium]
MTRPKAVRIPVGTGSVSGLLLVPPQPRAAFVFAHGAGAGMTHAFMEAVAQELSERGFATLRYQFPYMEAGSKRPDSPKVAHAAVRAAVAKARECLPGVVLVAGGKSFGGRMTSQAEAQQPLEVQGLAFFGFPLHPAGAPSDERAAHLDEVKVPMLFLQGTRDALADVNLLKPVVKTLGKRATLHLVTDADHTFHVPAKSGRKDAQVRAEILDAFAAWVASL